MIELKGNEPDWLIQQLEKIQVYYIDFYGNKKDGNIICNKYISNDIKEIFKEIFDIKFPIYSIIPISEFNWDDDISCSNNNTSCFNYRKILGTDKLSDHAMGLAIDINPLQNPWMTKKFGNLPKGSVYNINDKGTVTQEIVNIFKKHGFKWGGVWSEPDYQHFYKKI